MKAQLTGELRSERYRRLEKKVAAMLLQSLPKGVRDDLVAYRVQGVHQILYRLMVIFQPGGAQDRAQLLRQLDVADSAPTAAEAVVAIRRWYRLLQRASDLGVKLPDESIQTRSLTTIVKRVSEQNGDFKFRLALARTELQVDTRPNQTSVLKYMQHLVAELEQLGSVPKKSSGSAPVSATTTTTSTAPMPSTSPSNLKGLQGGEDPTAKAKAKAGATKKPCSWFGSDNGCRNGKDCTFLHSWSGLQRGERCLLCGSKKHRAKECTAGKGSGSPDRSSAGQLAKAAPVASPVVASVTKTATTTKDGPEAQAPTSSTTSTSSAPNANKIDSAQMTEILAETNKMLKTLTAQSQATSSTTASVDPLTLIQQQLDEVRRLKTMVVKEAGPPVDSFESATDWYEARLTTPPTTLCVVTKEDVALLDSGASHPYRGAQSDQELQQARRVAVSLATGEERSILQTREGTLLCEDGSEPPLVPMGQLVSLLGCTVKWTPSKLVVQHPVHGKLSVKIRGHCPVIPVGQALGLIAELEQARMQEFEKTVQGLQTQLKELRDSGRDQWSWQNHLEALREQGDRSYMAGFLHRCPTFTSAPPEVLLGIPEAIPRRDDDGWKMLRSMPWPRAKRKALFQSDGWVVSLFSGDVRSPGGRQGDAMRRTFWNNSLKGNDVLVEVDVTASKSLDLNQRDMVFKLLGWAALNGKIKAIVGGPPRRSYPKAEEPQTMMGQTLKEEQLLTRMVALWYMAEEGRRHAWRNGLLKDPPVKPHVAFMLEHPGGGERDRGSFFQSSMWKSFSEEELMGEVCCRMNGRPVVLGGNLDLGHLNGVSMGALCPDDQWSSVWPMEFIVDLAGALQSWKGLRNYEGVLASLVRAIPPEDAEAALDQLCKFDAASWKLHLQRDHLPYRRDCRVCVERASGRPHRKISHPSAYSLAVDLAGPFRVTGAGGYKYLMVGCYRLPKLPGIVDVAVEDKEEVDVPVPEDGKDWIMAEDDHHPDEAGEAIPDEAAKHEAVVLDVPGDSDKDHDEEVEKLRELAKPLEFASIYLVRPMKSRKKKDALRAVQELYVQLRSHGLPVCKLHSDRARELQTDALEAWAAARDIEVTKTQGSDPAGNATAERAVGYIKSRVRVLLNQAKEFGGLEDDLIRSWWPLAAEVAATQHQALTFGRSSPCVARFGSKVFTKRKGYGYGGRFDLQPRWLRATYLGPARTVPGGHLVYTDEGNLWYTTHIRQFEDYVADGDAPEPSAPPPARRIRRKSSVVEFAGGVGLLPGLRDDELPRGGEAHGMRAIGRLHAAETDASSVDVVSEPLRLDGGGSATEGDIGSTSRGPGDRAGEYLRDGRFSMRDCLEVLESEPFRKTKKQRALAWKGNEPPTVHTTLGAYQRGPWTGVTTATRRHGSLTKYLTAMFRHHCGHEIEFSSMTVAKDLCTDAHKDRFNLRNSRNLVLTVGEFEGGGIWQEGEREGFPCMAVQTSEDTVVKGYVMPVKNVIVKVDPKKLHKTMPWTGGPKWTIIAHTVGQHQKLEDGHRRDLRELGFPLPEVVAVKMLNGEASEREPPDDDVGQCGPMWFPSSSDSEERWRCMWARRLIDEEETLQDLVAPEQKENFQGVSEVNAAASAYLEQKEDRATEERLDISQWFMLCRMTEGEEEQRGVEGLLETLTSPLKVVYTVALDEVKQYVDRWAEAIHKEADALIKAAALVPLTAQQQKDLERSGKLVVLPAKGVFTIKPPDVETTVDEKGQPLPPGHPSFFKRKARLVICGNFQGKQSKEDSYAGGCQTDTLRAMLAHCAAMGWCLASTDIRNAFILAPIQEEDEPEEEIYALYPPKVLQLAKVQYALQLWRVDRALYGFRRSPRLWGRFRDKRLRKAKIPYCGGYLYLHQHKADENVWSIRFVATEGEETTVGHINIYVDDILYVGLKPVIEAVQQWLTEEWKASELTWATADATIRFLGLEIGRTDDGGVRLHQKGYIQELLRHHGDQVTRSYGTPCPQEWLLGEFEVEVKEFSPEQLRLAQALTGELLWLCGKSRPDLMHTVATMSSMCLRDPVFVAKVGLRALGYLRETIDIELYYKPTSSSHLIEGYSDASFAPQGSRSVGCSVARYLGQPVSWRSGRQALVALSVAEAELIEAINAVQLTYGLSAITAELQEAAPTIVIKVDNSAAVGLSNESAGTWKTRHLRVRAYHLREAVRLQELTIEHIPGLSQLSDLGTKAFHRPRLQQLMHTWGLLRPVDFLPSTSPVVAKMNETIPVLARLIVILGWLVQSARATPTRTEGIVVSFPWELYLVMIIGLVAAIGAWEALKWVADWLSLRRSGSVQESRGARRLRRLQQAVQEEVARYGLDDGEGPVTPVSTPVPTRPTSWSPYQSRTGRPATVVADVGVQTDAEPENYRRFPGPFVVSEHGDRVHYDGTCHGLGNALSRRRQLQLCQYCQQRQQLYAFVG